MPLPSCSQLMSSSTAGVWRLRKLSSRSRGGLRPSHRIHSSDRRGAPTTSGLPSWRAGASTLQQGHRCCRSWPCSTRASHSPVRDVGCLFGSPISVTYSHEHVSLCARDVLSLN